MKTLAMAAALFLSVGNPAAGHRLDEYLQATVISLERDHIQVEVRLTPGVAVLPAVLAEIDSNADGVISEAEQRSYAERVVRDISLACDGERMTPRLVAAKFPPIDEMKEGLGEIQIEFDTSVRSTGLNRSLTFENHHLGRISAYLVNALLPRDPEIRITAQNRNFSQSAYRLDFVVAGARADLSVWGCLGGFAVLLFARVVLSSHGGRRRLRA